MIKNEYHSSLILKRNTDANGHPISIDITDIKSVMDNHSCIILTQLPDEAYRVEIDNFIEVWDCETIAINEFKVDYANGVVYFNPRNIGKTLDVKYKGIGSELIYCSRIATRVDSQGNILETLEEVLDKAEEAVNVLETYGGAIKTVKDLESAITKGNSTKTNLDKSITNAQEDIAKIESTGNAEITIFANEWTKNGDVYEKQVVHNLNSENLLINARNSNKEAIHLAYKIVDKNTVLFKNDLAENVSIVLSGRYYKPFISSEVEEGEIVAARGQFATLNDRLLNTDKKLSTVIHYEDFTGNSIN